MWQAYTQVVGLSQVVGLYLDGRQRPRSRWLADTFRWQIFRQYADTQVIGISIDSRQQADAQVVGIYVCCMNISRLYVCIPGWQEDIQVVDIYLCDKQIIYLWHSYAWEVGIYLGGRHLKLISNCQRSLCQSSTHQYNSFQNEVTPVLIFFSITRDQFSVLP